CDARYLRMSNPHLDRLDSSRTDHIIGLSRFDIRELCDNEGGSAERHLFCRTLRDTQERDQNPRGNLAREGNSATDNLENTEKDAEAILRISHPCFFRSPGNRLLERCDLLR